MPSNFDELKHLAGDQFALPDRINRVVEKIVPRFVVNNLELTLNLSQQHALVEGLRTLQAELQNLPLDASTFSEWAIQTLGLPPVESSDTAISDELEQAIDTLIPAVEKLIGQDQEHALLAHLNRAIAAAKAENEDAIEKINKAALRELHSLGVGVNETDTLQLHAELTRLKALANSEVETTAFPLETLKTELTSLKQNLRNAIARVILDYDLDSQSLAIISEDLSNIDLAYTRHVRQNNRVRNIASGVSISGIVAGAAIAFATEHNNHIGLTAMIAGFLVAAISGPLLKQAGKKLETKVEKKVESLKHTATLIGAALEASIQAQLAGNRPAQAELTGRTNQKLLAPKAKTL